MYIWIVVILIVLTVMALIKLVSDKSAVTIFKQITEVLVKEVEVETIVTRIETVYVDKEVEVHWYQFLATGYSADDPSQGTNRTMASGKEVYEGAIAADPKILPIGTRVEIKGLSDERDGKYSVEDTGGKIKGLRIDIYCESYFEALQINQNVWVRIIEEV